MQSLSVHANGPGTTSYWEGTAGLPGPHDFDSPARGAARRSEIREAVETRLAFRAAHPARVAQREGVR